MNQNCTNSNHRPAWVELDLLQLKRNFDIINRDRAANVSILSVVKDEAYGHGASKVAEIALASGAVYLGVVTLDEALNLRNSGIQAPILLFGHRAAEELPYCVEYNLTCCVNDLRTAQNLSQLANSKKREIPIHVEIDTGLSRYGVSYTKALSLFDSFRNVANLKLEGIMSHFAMSDEEDKSFAILQLQRFQKILNALAAQHIQPKYIHVCNTGGFLDLPVAHFNMVRLGILPLGVYPSKVCRRISGLKPVMSVKSRIAAIQDISPGDTVGYGMRYKATSPRRIATLPFGYGDGYPRVRNQGSVLIHGKRAHIVGGNAMDAMLVDITNIPAAKLWDEVVVMGKQDKDEITVHEIANLKNSVSYDILAGWRWRLPRIYLNDE